MKIYTKKGDLGQTSAPDGRTVFKDDLSIEALGAIDEANSVIGVTLAHIKDEKVKKILLNLSSLMFSLGADLISQKDLIINGSHIALLEKALDDFAHDLPEIHNFILPQGSKGAAFLHQARSVVRRAERRIVALSHKTAINPELLIFINRLSDLLFVLARSENLKFGSEIVWSNESLTGIK